MWFSLIKAISHSHETGQSTEMEEIDCLKRDSWFPIICKNSFSSTPLSKISVVSIWVVKQETIKIAWENLRQMFFQRSSYEQQDVAQAEGSCCSSWSRYWGVPIQSPKICCKVGGDKYGRSFCLLWEFLLPVAFTATKKNVFHFGIITRFQNSETLTVSLNMILK